MALVPTSLDEIDFWDLDMFEFGDPHAAWSLLRAQAPVWWHERDRGEHFWSITRYDDCHTVHAAPTLFSSERDGIVIRTHEQMATDYAGSQDFKPMIHTDPPRHAPLRKVISHNFT